MTIESDESIFFYCLQTVLIQRRNIKESEFEYLCQNDHTPPPLRCCMMVAVVGGRGRGRENVMGQGVLLLGVSGLRDPHRS